LEGTVKDMDSGSGSVGRYSHDELGARYLRGLGFPEKVYTLVGEHVNAKRYLCGIDPAYLEKLSEASKESLGFQGGPMNSEERRTYEEVLGGDVVKDVVRVRKWDDGGKVVGVEVQGLETYRGLIRSVLERDGKSDIEK
jgi:predicted HD phosphohydrolase